MHMHMHMCMHMCMWIKIQVEIFDLNPTCRVTDFPKTRKGAALLITQAHGEITTTPDARPAASSGRHIKGGSRPPTTRSSTHPWRVGCRPARWWPCHRCSGSDAPRAAARTEHAASAVASCQHEPCRRPALHYPSGVPALPPQGAGVRDRAFRRPK